ncbi:MAG: hypothetical protein R2733_16905 [Acidimicrobiales bacterium]
MRQLLTYANRLLLWLERHPVSRAGALALASARRRRSASSGPLWRRITAQALGSLLVSFGVAVTLATDTGVGPLDVFTIGLAERLALPLSVAVWSMTGVLMVMATVLRNPPRLGTLITPFVIGAVLGPLSSVMAPLGSLPFVYGMLVQAAAITVIGLGAGAIVVSGFGAGLGELISEATSLRFGRSVSLTRLTFEISFLVMGIAIGGPFGPGTLLVAALIGPSVASGVRWCEPLVTGRTTTISDTPLGSPSTNHHRTEVPEAGRALVHR